MAEGPTLSCTDSAMGSIRKFGQTVSRESEEMDKMFAHIQHNLNDLEIESKPGDGNVKCVQALMNCSERLTRYAESLKNKASCIDKTSHLMQTKSQLRDFGGRRTHDSGIYSTDSNLFATEQPHVTMDPVQEETEQQKRKHMMMSSLPTSMPAYPQHDSESATWNNSEESSIVDSSTLADEK